jgi:hypothetical protein
LAVRDITPNTGLGINERAFEFRSTEDCARGFALSISSNTDTLSLESWAAMYSPCVRETFSQGNVDGQPAIFCNSKPAGVKEKAVVFETAGKVVLLSAVLSPSDSDQVVASLRLR